MRIVCHRHHASEHIKAHQNNITLILRLTASTVCGNIHPDWAVTEKETAAETCRMDTASAARASATPRCGRAMSDIYALLCQEHKRFCKLMRPTVCDVQPLFDSLNVTWVEGRTLTSDGLPDNVTAEFYEMCQKALERLCEVEEKKYNRTVTIKKHQAHCEIAISCLPTFMYDQPWKLGLMALLFPSSFHHGPGGIGQVARLVIKKTLEEIQGRRKPLSLMALFISEILAHPPSELLRLPGRSVESDEERFRRLTSDFDEAARRGKSVHFIRHLSLLNILGLGEMTNQHYEYGATPATFGQLNTLDFRWRVRGEDRVYGRVNVLSETESGQCMTVYRHPLMFLCSAREGPLGQVPLFLRSSAYSGPLSYRLERVQFTRIGRSRGMRIKSPSAVRLFSYVPYLRASLSRIIYLLGQLTAESADDTWEDRLSFGVLWSHLSSLSNAHPLDQHEAKKEQFTLYLHDVLRPHRFFPGGLMRADTQILAVVVEMKRRFDETLHPMNTRYNGHGKGEGSHLNSFADLLIHIQDTPSLHRLTGALAALPGPDCITNLSQKLGAWLKDQIVERTQQQQLPRQHLKRPSSPTEHTLKRPPMRPKLLPSSLELLPVCPNPLPVCPNPLPVCPNPLPVCPNPLPVCPDPLVTCAEIAPSTQNELVPFQCPTVDDTSAIPIDSEQSMTDFGRTLTELATTLTAAEVEELAAYLFS